MKVIQWIWQYFYKIENSTYREVNEPSVTPTPDPLISISSEIILKDLDKHKWILSHNKTQQNGDCVHNT